MRCCADFDNWDMRPKLSLTALASLTIDVELTNPGAIIGQDSADALALKDKLASNIDNALNNAVIADPATRRRQLVQNANAYVSVLNSPP